MYRKQRQDEILEILRKQGFSTVAQLTELLHYSTATINRDLNALEKQNLVRRSYGGVEPLSPKWITHSFRLPKMRRSKRRIAARAASFVKDGEMIFADGSTTTEYMAEFLRERKDLTVVTNNNLLATDLYPHGVRVICLGGVIVEEPCITGGDLCAHNAALYYADKMFFSTGAVSSAGAVGGASAYFTMMMRNSKEVFLLVDREKIDKPFRAAFCDFSAIDVVISDYEFPAATKAAFPNTRFICTDAPEEGAQADKR